jgi:hypothetical protein
MEDLFDKEENAKNIYVIRRKLAALKKRTGYADWVYDVGPFMLSMLVSMPDEYWDSRPEDSILNHDRVDVFLMEIDKNNHRSYISLREDSRFRNYQPIMYDTYSGPNGIVNCGDGHNMPIHHLCELIRYLHRLSNLTAFT